MKKPIYLLFALFMLSMVSCKQAAGVGGGNADMKNNNSLLLEKEKKTQVEEKEYKENYWSVAIKSRLNDTRPIEEKLIGTPEGYDIINTVLYTKETLEMGSPSFSPSFEIQKTVKYKSGEIVFVLTIEILTSNAYLSNCIMLPAQLQLSNNQSLNYNCQVSYKDEPSIQGVHTVICKTNIYLNNVNLLRLQQDDIVVIVKEADKEFKFKLPHKFIEFLREI